MTQDAAHKGFCWTFPLNRPSRCLEQFQTQGFLRIESTAVQRCARKRTEFASGSKITDENRGDMENFLVLLTQQVSHRPINANPACGHKEVRRSTGHIMVTTRYSDQQGSKWRQKVMRLYKRWHRPISKRFIKPPYSIREQPRSTRNVVAYPRPAFSAKNRKNYAPTSFDQQVQVSQGHTFCTEIRKIEIPRSMVVEALNW